MLDAYSESVASKLKAILDDCSSVGYTVVSFSEEYVVNMVLTGVLNS